MKRLDRVKIRVNNKIIMEELLDLLFSNGYTWPNGSTKIEFLDAHALYIDSGLVRVSLNKNTFVDDSNMEISIQNLKRQLSPTLRSLLEK